MGAGDKRGALHVHLGGGGGGVHRGERPECMGRKCLKKKEEQLKQTHGHARTHAHTHTHTYTCTHTHIHTHSLLLTGPVFRGVTRGSVLLFLAEVGIGIVLVPPPVLTCFRERVGPRAPRVLCEGMAAIVQLMRVDRKRNTDKFFSHICKGTCTVFLPNKESKVEFEDQSIQ